MNKFTYFLLLFFISVSSLTPLLSQNRIDREDPATILKIASEDGRKPEQVIQLSNQVLALLSKVDKPDLVAKAYQLLGKSNRDLNQFSTAIDFYKRSEQIFIQLKDSASLAGAMNNIGNCYQMISEYDRAIEYLQKALKISENLRIKKINASILNNLGIIYQQTKQYDQSLNYHNQALLLFNEIGDKKGYSSTQNNIGLAYSSIGKYQEALVWFNKAIIIKNEINDTLNLANTYESIGQVHEKIDNFSKAIEYYSEALRLHQLIKNNYGVVEDYISLASVNIKIKNYQKVYEYLSEIEKKAEHVENYIALKDSYKVLSDYNLAIGNPYQSRAMMLKYALMVERIFSKQVSDKLSELTAKHETEKKEYQNKFLQANLEIESVRFQRSKEVQFFFFIICIVFISLLIYTIFLLRKLRIKNYQVVQINKELNNLNVELEANTARKTKELTDALRKTEESDKLKSEFLANISHEVRTPMNGILGFAKVLENNELSAEDRRLYLDVINRQGRSLLQIINDIISLSKIEAGQMEIKNTACNINKKLDDLSLIFNNPTYLYKKDGVALKIVKTQSNEKSNIVIDPVRVEQILINLIDNAYKFTSEGEIELGYSFEKHNTIKFYVKDTGVGIPEDQLDKIFNRFYRHIQPNQPSHRGAGLGLSISKRLANILGGDLYVESIPNKGSLFYFVIPFTPAELIDNNTTSIPKKNTNYWPNKVVLVVEDDQISFQFIQAILKGSGLRLIHAKSGEDAVTICQSDEVIDLVLMDIQLPFMSGHEATKQIKSIRKNLTVIAQTANVLDEEKNLSLEAGCKYYIIKPIESDDLYSTISKCFEGD
ncbi:MAG: tetratricopeptide repeat protein [Bacteroidales bacterium]|nr:tetratricopeptide repeat protein [Bacteroidales bacterium]